MIKENYTFDESNTFNNDLRTAASSSLSPLAKILNEKKK